MSKRYKNDVDKTESIVSTTIQSAIQPVIEVDNSIQSYENAKRFLKDHNIMISTITLDCKLHTLINVNLFAKHVILKEDEVVSVKYGDRNDLATNRTIVPLTSKKNLVIKIFTIK